MWSISVETEGLSPLNHSRASPAASFSASFLLVQGFPTKFNPLKITVERNWLFFSSFVLYVGASCPALASNVCRWFFKLLPSTPPFESAPGSISFVAFFEGAGRCRPKTNLPSHWSSETSNLTVERSLSLYNCISCLGSKSCPQISRKSKSALTF